MKRRLILIAALALGVAACGGASGNSTTTAPEPESTTTAPAVEAVLLSYSLAAGDEFEYEVGLDQHIEMTASGDPSLMGGEEVPGEAALDLAGTATFTHVVSDGPQPDTYEVHITGEFTDVSVTGTIDGQPVDSDVAPDFATLDPIDVTVVVDEQGNLIQDGATGAEDPLAGMFGDLGALGGDSSAPGLDPGKFIGPPFSDQEVTVGDAWSDEVETPGFGGEPIVTSITTTVTGVEELDGTEVLVIESNSSTSLIEVDLAEFFAGMFEGFATEEATPEETAELEAILDQLHFLISVDGTTADSRTWFDAEAGVARQSETTSGANISMDMSIPDEQTGEMVGFVMDMNLDQDISYRLISGPTA
ncbi:MAG: acid shock protein [Acidimicrobiia bacterium]